MVNSNPNPHYHRNASQNNPRRACHNPRPCYRRESQRRYRQVQKSVQLRSIHDRSLIESIKDCQPVKRHGYTLPPSRRLIRKTVRMPRVVYTVMNKTDIITCIRNFL